MEKLGVEEEFLNLWTLGIESTAGPPPFTAHMERTGVLRGKTKQNKTRNFESKRQEFASQFVGILAAWLWER